MLRQNGIQFHQWRLCTRGAGELLLRGRRYTLKPGIGFFLPAGEPHTYRGSTEDFTMDAFGFDGEAATVVLKTLQFLEPGVYRLSRPDLFRDHVRVLAEIAQDGQPFPGDRVSGELHKFLLGIPHSIRRVPDPLFRQKEGAPSFVPEMIAYMEEHCEEPLSLEDMAERMMRSKEHVCTVFKRETGMTYVEFLTRVRLFRVRTLLLDHPEMPLAEVARHCGFFSPSYFGGVFKRDVGVSPGRFRLNAQR